MSKKVLLFGGIGCGLLLIACLAFVGIAFVLGMGGTQPAAEVGDKFLTALKDGNYAQAYKLCAPALQQKLGSVQALENLIENGKVQPVKWSFNSRSVNNDEAELEGTVTMKGNREGNVSLSLVNAGGEWQVIGFNLKEK